MALEFAKRIRRIPVYPAADGYALDDDVALLASNESPFRPLPEVVAAAQRAIEGVNRYPDPGSSALRAALSARYGVPANRIAVGNGSCDVLLAAGEALLEPGAELVYAWPSFSMYPHLAAATGATAVTVDLDADDRLDLESLAEAVTVATRLLIVCNPNNPTSTAVPAAAIADRLGLEDGLRELGLQPADSQANFVWVGLGQEREEADVVRGLAERRVLVRAGTALGREGFLRVTVGTPEQNERFLAALRELL